MEKERQLTGHYDKSTIMSYSVRFCLQNVLFCLAINIMSDHAPVQSYRGEGEMTRDGAP